ITQVNIDELIKVRKHPFSSFPRKRESRKIKHFWTPAFAGVTALETFYECIIIDPKRKKSVVKEI
ncbi:MAG: hypothetical protein JRH09_15610, partial [Deltaproteobacteria bacterium]|nr:hypothetical protein [Deltaproteobacteria bacterium]